MLQGGLGFLGKHLCTQAAYAEFKLRTHAHDIRAWDFFNNPNPKIETENRAQTQKP